MRFAALRLLVLSYLLVAQDVTLKCTYGDGVFEVVFDGPQDALVEADSLQVSFPEGVQATAMEAIPAEVPMGHRLRYRLEPPEKPAWAPA